MVFMIHPMEKDSHLQYFGKIDSVLVLPFYLALASDQDCMWIFFFFFLFGTHEHSQEVKVQDCVGLKILFR